MEEKTREKELSPTELDNQKKLEKFWNQYSTEELQDALKTAEKDYKPENEWQRYEIGGMTPDRGPTPEESELGYEPTFGENLEMIKKILSEREAKK